MAVSKTFKKLAGVPDYVRNHWRTTNPGEYMTLREAVYYCIGSMGINAVNYTITLIAFSAGYFCGSIMGISNQEFYIIGLMGTVFGYVFMFMNPIGVLILRESRTYKPENDHICAHFLDSAVRSGHRLIFCAVGTL